MSTSRLGLLRRLKAAGPVGMISKSDFELVEVPITEPGDGQFVVAVTQIEAFPGTLERLLTGENTGKARLEVRK